MIDNKKKFQGSNFILSTDPIKIRKWNMVFKVSPLENMADKDVVKHFLKTFIKHLKKSKIGYYSE